MYSPVSPSWTTTSSGVRKVVPDLRPVWVRSRKRSPMRKPSFRRKIQCGTLRNHLHRPDGFFLKLKSSRGGTR